MNSINSSITNFNTFSYSKLNLAEFKKTLYEIFEKKKLDSYSYTLYTSEIEYIYYNVIIKGLNIDGKYSKLFAKRNRIFKMITAWKLKAHHNNVNWIVCENYKQKLDYLNSLLSNTDERIKNTYYNETQSKV